MSTELIYFTLLYIFLSISIIYPPVEFVTAELTISDVFSSFLGIEFENFISYHIKRINLTLFIHTFLLFFYIMNLVVYFGKEQFVNSSFFILFMYLSIFIQCFVLFKILLWSHDQSNHPICEKLQKLTLVNQQWTDTALEINAQIRGGDNLVIETNTVTKIIVTNNWLIKITPYSLYFGRQDNTVLKIISSDVHDISVVNLTDVQYLNLEAKSAIANVDPFYIRISSVDFRNLEDKWTRPIPIIPNVILHRSVIERFINAFKDLIKDNTPYVAQQPLEICMGCAQTPANVKIQRLCENPTPSQLQLMLDREPCTSCNCRPSWCVDCLARWFASRQDPQTPMVWMSGKCTCPVCRARFCVWDVSFVQT